MLRYRGEHGLRASIFMQTCRLIMLELRAEVPYALQVL